MILAAITEFIQNALPAGIMMLGLGTVFAIVLLIASEKLKVTVDPKTEQVKNALPGIDCGACGFAGCSAYAKAVSADPSLLGKCAPGGQKTAEAIARILNLQVSNSAAPKRPIVHCRAHKGDKTYLAGYYGIQTCISANALSNVQACIFGCLGFGDCVKACKFDAIHIINGLATVDYEKCTGCTACAKACPRNIIEMVPFTYDEMITVACSSKENGKTTKQMCKVGCIGCKLCSKQSNIFIVEENLAKVNYPGYKPSSQNQTALDKCPTNVIIHVGKRNKKAQPKTKETTSPISGSVE